MLVINYPPKGIIFKVTHLNFQIILNLHFLKYEPIRSYAYFILLTEKLYAKLCIPSSQ